MIIPHFLTLTTFIGLILKLQALTASNNWGNRKSSASPVRSYSDYMAVIWNRSEQSFKDSAGPAGVSGIPVQQLLVLLYSFHATDRLH